LKAQLEPGNIVQLFDQLIIYRSLKRDRLINELLKIIANEPFNPSLSGWLGSILEKFPKSLNAWASYLWNLIENDENYFALACEGGKYQKIPANIIHAVYNDLKILGVLLHWEPFSGFPIHVEPGMEVNLNPGFDALYQNKIDPCLGWLADFYRKRGAGLFGNYSSFVWSSPAQHFKPVTAPDQITFEDLIGYESQKKALIQNTLQFLKDLPANNILLYGDRGTGKSSSIKALSHRFTGERLRLIEVGKEDLKDFPLIVAKLRTRGLKFILYVDDLSFDSTEIQYKHLKAVLEGGLEVRPSNVLIYATSNRRHLVKETFADRQDELHENDVIQEKLSLSDRFGITLTYTAPSQEEYLAIVKQLIVQRGIKLAWREIEARAILWERQQNLRSGRTAKQFVDQLEGELGLITSTN
jgi:predicted AAA+ superfamily ATPase